MMVSLGRNRDSRDETVQLDDGDEIVVVLPLGGG
jgi:molybdopterin converting factor small subunit